MRMTTRGKKLDRLLAGADQGAYKLPAAVVEARAVADRAASVPPQPRPAEEATVWRGAVDKAVATFLAGGTELPDASKAIEASRAAVVGWERGEQLRVEVANALEVRLAELVVDDQGDDIIVSCLQPALAAVVATVEAAAKVLPDDPHLNDALVLVARDDIRRAWVEATTAADRYRLIVQAVEALSIPSGVDRNAEFAWVENLDEIWPRPVHRNMPSATKAPWPAEQPQRILWLVRHGAKLIAPTTSERDALWQARYGGAVAQQKMARHNAEGYRAVFS